MKKILLSTVVLVMQFSNSSFAEDYNVYKNKELGMSFKYGTGITLLTDETLDSVLADDKNLNDYQKAILNNSKQYPDKMKVVILDGENILTINSLQGKELINKNGGCEGFYKMVRDAHYKQSAEYPEGSWHEKDIDTGHIKGHSFRLDNDIRKINDSSIKIQEVKTSLFYSILINKDICYYIGGEPETKNADNFEKFHNKIINSIELIEK